MDRKLSEYLTSKYKNDPVTLRIQLIKKDLEPFVHYTVDLVREVFGDEEAQKKMLFGDWWEEVTRKEDFINLSFEQLAIQRDKFFDDNLTEPEGSQNIQDE